MSTSHSWTRAFGSFSKRQTELNRFLWTTELTYGIIKQKGILDCLPQNNLAWDEFSNIICEAWFPNVKGEIKYKGTIAEMSHQLDGNITYVLFSVAALLITEYEVFVEDRFPDLILRLKNKSKQGYYTIPGPVELVRELTSLYNPQGTPITDPVITLKADLMKKIRNLYAHKGLQGIPRRIDHPEMKSWQNYVAKKDISLYSHSVTDDVVKDVVGSAIRKSRSARKRGKSLGEEFFFALYTFTNIRTFVERLDVAFPP